LNTGEDEWTVYPEMEQANIEFLHASMDLNYELRETQYVDIDESLV